VHTRLYFRIYGLLRCKIRLPKSFVKRFLKNYSTRRFQ